MYCTITLRFLSIILRVLRLKVSVVDFLNHREGGMVLYQVSSFLLNRNCKKLHEFEEIDISSKAVEVSTNSKEENSSEIVWILSKNSASGLW
jgi:hypothetical protein